MDNVLDDDDNLLKCFQIIRGEFKRIEKPSQDIVAQEMKVAFLRFL